MSDRLNEDRFRVAVPGLPFRDSVALNVRHDGCCTGDEIVVRFPHLSRKSPNKVDVGSRAHIAAGNDGVARQRC